MDETTKCPVCGNAPCTCTPPVVPTDLEAQPETQPETPVE